MSVSMQTRKRENKRKDALVESKALSFSQLWHEAFFFFDDNTDRIEWNV